MVNGFPQLSNIDDTTFGTINNRAGKNVSVSALKPWIRVISSVDGGLVIESIPKNDSFSQRYGNSKRAGRVGINFKGNDVLEDISVRGYRPSPTIDSVDVQNGAQGLSRKTTFTIVCYTLGQVEMVTKHFLEPGYTALVEYGWNTKSSYNQKCKLDICSIASYNNIKTIISKRKASEGTYDAVLGYITGGGISYGDGETFNVAVELTSLGEIPAYLQQQRGIVKVNDKNTIKTGKKFQSEQIQGAQGRGILSGKKNIGKALFMQMYNDLPQSKQIESIKKLVDEDQWNDPANFINMDEKIRETLRDDFDGNLAGVAEVKLKTTTNGKAVAKIPEGVSLITDQRFIRMDLAFKIINTVEDVDLQPKMIKGGKCDATFVMNNLIDISSTVCRGHKHMFSTDISKLYIPNRHLPNFGLTDALTSDEIKSSFINLNNIDALAEDGHPQTTRAYRYFPRLVPTTIYDLNKIDNTFNPYELEPYSWGLLRDLYVNFDFFKEVISRKGLLIKDVVLDLLNGISSAVNMYWEFQIIDRCSSGGDEAYGDEYDKSTQSAAGVVQLQVRDVTLSGKPLKTNTRVKHFQSRGVKTPFLTSELKMDIPGAMKNMIVGQRNAGISINQDGQDMLVNENGLFSNRRDPVLDEINSFIASTNPPDTGSADQRDTDRDGKVTDAEKEEQRKKNIELFTSTAGIIPRIQDMSGNIDAVKNWYDFIDTNGTTLEELMIVGTFNDPSLLKIIQQIDNGIIINGQYKGVKNNSIILPIGFNFTLHGVSGLKVGDVFKIDDLPNKYSSKIFQIMRINNSLTDDGWITSVEANIRNTDVV